ncbi:siphovirus ReqiPepy6 Gp37-like family protein, partial [Eubacterium callanderi]|nr:siphovirus ReqiPepy6 Gp37-like family protein [Eubacterium callanderi]
AKTTAYVAGQGEGENREILILGDDLTDVDRREVFIDARDIEQGESTALEDRGAAKLKEYQVTDSFEFEVITRDYRKKWDLGDITTFYDKDLDYLDNNQIVEIQETYEADGIKIEPTFGDPVKTITDVVKSTSEEIKTESRTSVGGDKT